MFSYPQAAGRLPHLSGAKQTTLERKPERGPGDDLLRPVPGVPPRTRLGQRARGVVSFPLRTLAREGRMTVNIGRRELLAALGGAAVAWPLAARAQQPREPIRRIGVLLTGAADDPESLARVGAFLQGLQELGWTDGRNVRIEYRWGSADAERIRKSAAELVALAPDVIVVSGNSGAVGPFLGVEV